MYKKLLLVYDDYSLTRIYFFDESDDMVYIETHILNITFDDELTFREVNELISKSDLEFKSLYHTFDKVINMVGLEKIKIMNLRKDNIQKYLDKVNI